MLNDAIKIYKTISHKDVRCKDLEIEKILKNEGYLPNKFLDLNRSSPSESTSESIVSNTDSLSCHVWSKIYTVNYVELFDLTSAFSEGFDGYSIGLEIGSNCFETDRQDVNGKQVVWDSLFEM